MSGMRPMDMSRVMARAVLRCLRLDAGGSPAAMIVANVME